MNRHQRRREAATERQGGNYVAKREAYVKANPPAKDGSSKLVIRHEMGCAIRRKHRCDCEPYIGWQT